MSETNERELKRKAIESLFVLFPETAPSAEAMEAYLDSLARYQAQDVSEACRLLQTAWKSRSAPRPAHIIEQVWNVIRERKRLLREGGAGRAPGRVYHPEPVTRGDLAHRARLLDTACRGLSAERLGHLVGLTAGMPTGGFHRCCQRLERRKVTSAELSIDHLWSAFDEIRAEDRVEDQKAFATSQRTPTGGGPF